MTFIAQVLQTQDFFAMLTAAGIDFGGHLMPDHMCGQFVRICFGNQAFRNHIPVPKDRIPVADFHDFIQLM